MLQSLHNTLRLGDSGPEEFTPVVEWLRKRDTANGLRSAIDLSGVRTLLEAGDWFPELVVVLQGWSEQFSTGEVHELMALCPLARIVCCFGPWCDSDGRTRSIWPLAMRVPAAAAVSRLEHELNVLGAAAEPVIAPLPWTASRTEIFEYDFAAAPSRCDQKNVSVISPDRSWREMMERRAGSRSAQATCATEMHPPDVVLFDADPWNEERADALVAVKRASPGCRLIALVGFPRPDLEAELRRSGADAVQLKVAPCP